ncbi:hypothetical protein [Aquamicrobium ahrensii]|uniref:Uncharacterized protein n=1 Tax=Aquamicrobium ahrensii TaxID=469551 RepID=A0ABV2KNZ3_9HYPH
MTLLLRLYAIIAISKIIHLLIDLMGILLPAECPRRAGFRPAELMLLGSLVGLSICLLWIWISARAGR